MADEEDRHALVAEVLDQLEELHDLMRGERRRRLVHDEDADIQRNRLGDLDRLLGGERQPARRAAHVEGHAEGGEDLLGLTEHLPPIGDRAAALMADEDVLRHVEIGEEERLLVDCRDAVALRLGGAADRDRLAGQEDLAAVRLVDAGHDLDQRRLAGAVLAEERVHLAGMEGQRDGLERLGRGKALGDVANFEDRRDRRLSARRRVAFRRAHPFRLPARLRAA